MKMGPVLLALGGWLAVGGAVAGPADAAEAPRAAVPAEHPVLAGVPEDPPPLAAPAFPDRFLLASVQGNVQAQPSPAMDAVYGKAAPLSLEIRATLLPDERIGVGLGVGVQGRKGTGVAPSGAEPPATRMWQVPIVVEGLLRLLVWRSQPVVPYLRAGPCAVIWTESWDEERMTGLKWGVQGAVGAQIRLPFPEINARGRMAGDPVLDDIWLHVEGWARSASNFGSPGLDLSSGGGGIGLTLLL